MIHNLSIDNYGPFQDGFRLSCHEMEGSNTITCIFGTNSSGKTSLVDAISSVRDLLLSRMTVKDFVQKLNRDIQYPHQVSFRIKFDSEGRIYDYLGSIDTSSFRFVYEKLTAETDGSELTVFDTEGPWVRLRNLHEQTESISFHLERTSILCRIVDENAETNPLESFYRAGNRLQYKETVDEIIRVRSWLNNLTILGPARTRIHFDVGVLDGFLRSLGIDLRTSLTPIADELQRYSLMGFVSDRLRGTSYGHTRDWVIMYDYRLYYVKSKDGKLESYELKFRDPRSGEDKGFWSLSAGQRRAVELSALIGNNDPDQVFIVDEMDRKIHTNITLKILRIFAEKGIGQQLIMTSHESELIDRDYIDVGNMWLVDKPKGESSYLYSFPEPDMFDDLKVMYVENRLV